MAQSVERSCTFLVAAEALPSPAEIKAALEDGDDRSRAAAMRAAVSGVLNGGEPIPGLFITIVRYVLPSEDHTVQKLLLLYLETIEKTDASGKLLPEMILICQNLRNNLQHPNEYVRGCTLRFLCRLREEEIVEPLAPSVLQCLDHRHSYVRRNAVLALGAVYRLPRGDALLADAPDAVAALLEGGEQDASTRRAAFAFLGEHAPDRAASYLLQAGDGVAGWTEALQLAALELVRRQCRADPGRNKPRFLGAVLALLGSASPAVQFECATTLLALSRAPSAARAAGATLAGLLRSQSDNNVKLIVLGRLSDLKKRARDVVADLMMEVLAAGLGSADADVRGRTLALALDLISLRNVDGAVAVLKKEIVAAGGGMGGGSGGASSSSSSTSDEAQAAAAHRAELVRALHAAAARFPDVAGSVVPLLMDFIADGGAPPPPLTAAALLAAGNNPSAAAASGALAPLPSAAASTALDVAVFAREIAATQPRLRADILARVLDALPLMRAPRAACVALWMLGEFCEEPGAVAGALDALKAALGPLPIVSDDGDGKKRKKSKKKRTENGGGGGGEESDGGDDDDDDDETNDENAAARAAAAASAPSRPQVLPDGSYATQSAQLTAAAPASAAAVAKAGAFAKGGAAGGALAAAAALAAGHSLRAFVLSGDPLVGPATSAALTKLVLRLAGAPGAAGSRALNRAAAESMLAIAALLRAATTVTLTNPNANVHSSAASIDGGGVERMQACLRALAKGVSAAAEAAASSSSSSDKEGLESVRRPWLSSCRAALDAVVAASVAEATAAAAAVAAAATAAAPDDPLDLSLLRGKGGGDDGALDGDDDLGAAVAGSGDGTESAVSSENANAANPSSIPVTAPVPPRIVQLTGVGDPIYVEACLTTHAYDIALDVTMLNRTRKTLTNVALELATLGDLKLAERPRPVNLAPGATAKVRACVKVASTETGAIFGNVTFDAPPASSSSNVANGMEPPSTTVVTLADIHVDVMSFVSPAVIPDADFRERWASHEWENKIAVATDIPSAKDFLAHVASVAHMRVLTPPAALAGDCRFLAANLYARSRFGEDALLNLAVEEGADGRLAGAVRIRSKTQGMALSVGDVLILKQKGSSGGGGGGGENTAPEVK